MTSRKSKATEQSVAGSSRDNKRPRTDTAEDTADTTPNDTRVDTEVSNSPSSSTQPAVVGDPPQPATPVQMNGASIVMLQPPAPMSRTAGEPVVEADLTLRAADHDYILPSFIPRLLSIMNYTEPDANRYNIGLVPVDATWGAAGDGSGNDKFICLHDRPLAVWMEGIVTSIWLNPPEGSRVSVGVRLLCQRDQDAARYFQYSACRPAGDATHSGVGTYAGRFINGNTPVVFEDVYDGTDRLAGWSTMTKIDAARIQKTDVVLVECYIKRFRSREGSSRYTWTSWGVGFELLRIAHVLPGPGPADLLPEDSQVNL